MVSNAEPVKGLHLFRERFKEFEDCYVLIGGTASLLVLREAGLPFRATKDLDIVLCAEALDDRFFAAFWKFVRDGEYEEREEASGRRRYYRFQRPRNQSFPAMLELFSRAPAGIRAQENMVLTPIPTDSDISSLSAILLDSPYYDWVLNGRRTIEGVKTIGAEHLIPLKARAFLDLSARRANREEIDKAKVNKHRSDIARLTQLLVRAPLKEDVPEEIRADIRRFLIDSGLTSGDLRNLGTQIRDPAVVIDVLTVVYRL